MNTMHKTSFTNNISSTNNCSTNNINFKCFGAKLFIDEAIPEACNITFNYYTMKILVVLIKAKDIQISF